MDRGTFVDHGTFVAHRWIICGVFWTIRDLFWPVVGSLLDRIEFFRHFMIGLSIGMVCVNAVL